MSVRLQACLSLPPLIMFFFSLPLLCLSPTIFSGLFWVCLFFCEFFGGFLFLFCVVLFFFFLFFFCSLFCCFFLRSKDKNCVFVSMNKKETFTQHSVRAVETVTSLQGYFQIYYMKDYRRQKEKIRAISYLSLICRQAHASRGTRVL